MAPRQKISRPSTGNGFTLAQPPPPRSRGWEKDNPTASYRIPKVLREEIAAVAKERGLGTSEIARAFLEYSLDAYRSGALKLNPVLSGKLTLFPE